MYKRCITNVGRNGTSSYQLYYIKIIV